MQRETVRYDVTDGIAVLTLDRPGNLNAFTVQMADDLEAAFDEVSGDPAVGAVVVTGSGKAFCAGMDLSSEGNVFGLDETLRPTCRTWTTTSTTPPSSAASVTPAGGCRSRSTGAPSR